ncbi:MAG: protein-methionine-sulfoxide reductase catalytic subunit MsrP, partial [Gemmatimonadaceae bacterium]
MLIRVSPQHPIRSSDITPEDAYQNRRDFLKKSGLIGLGAAGFLGCAADKAQAHQQGTSIAGAELKPELTPWEDVTTYNNYYEFGTGKEDPAENATKFQTKPWTVKVEGAVGKPGTYNLEDFVKPHKLEDRIYRHRCVEAWSMVVPWQGIAMADVIKRFEPTSAAKFVEFTTLHDPRQMPGQRAPVLEWPYVEGLRLDEAMNPLAMFVTGVYGKTLPNQNGAPLRIVMPWKYGFKGGKSIVRIRFRETMPKTAWNIANPGEYGFYANVNPTVDHPRWTQSKERRIGEFRRRETLMFNGYAQHVASMYSGMDL